MKTELVTFGEIMLRLNPPPFERFFQSPQLHATFGGGEANVAASVARFGHGVLFVSALPANALGDACVAHLNRHRVDTSELLRCGERLGVYYLEIGASQRPSKVVYDRAHSSISTLPPGSFDWQRIFEGRRWFHISGITPALSASAAELSLQAVKAAHDAGLTVSCDYNYRSKLWNYGVDAPDVMRELVRMVDIGIANEEDCQKSLGVYLDEADWHAKITSGQLDLDKYEALAKKVVENFPNLQWQAITLRESLTASHNRWSACLWDGKDFYSSPRYDLSPIVDRIGGGDAFAAGLIFAKLEGMGPQDTLDFATAASCLKHSVYGDFNLVSVEEVFTLMKGDGSGRVQR